MTLYLIVILVFLGTAMMVFFIAYQFLPRKSFLEERIEDLSAEAGRPSVSPLVRMPATPWERFLERLGRMINLSPSNQNAYIRMLVAAGLRRERFPIFMGLKIFLAVALPFTYLVSYGIPLGKSTAVVFLFTVALAIIGFIAPGFWLSAKVRKRQLKIFYDLPDVLDLMTICVEAGLSLDAAMIRITESSQFEKNPLATELKMAMQETRAGKPRQDALRDMGERTMVDDLKSFSAMLIQTERLGTSLAESLRIHSDSLRIKRRQMAEEAAAKTSIKLLFPLAFLLFPAMFVVVLLPALIRIARVFAGIGE